MKVTKIMCDIRDCPLEATFRVSHAKLADIEFPTYGSRKIEVDLCLPHAERFTITGTGAWQTDKPLRPDL
jgi:hypothetical protein